MSIDAKQLIERVGETDQLYLSENSPALALERAGLRLQLVQLSAHYGEKIHFLQEAIVLLEQARIEAEDLELALYLKLSLQLAKAYLVYFELSKESRFALIAQQILKPLAHYDQAEILFFLAYAAAAQNLPALTRHWLGKYAKHTHFDFALVHEHYAFRNWRSEVWYQDIMQQKFS